MASIQKMDKGWRVQINIKGDRDDRTFSHKTQATDSVVKREAENGRHPGDDRSSVATLTGHQF